jgi:hypothetical protein
VADLHRTGGDTLPDDETRARTRAARSRPWDRPVAVPATAADRGVFWTPTVDEAQYPTRMARRRALQAAEILDGWRPDPVLTPPLLSRVGDELLRLFHEPVEVLAEDVMALEQDLVAPPTVAAAASPATALHLNESDASVAPMDDVAESGVRRDGTHGSRASRKGWLSRRRRHRPGADGTSAEDMSTAAVPPDSSAATNPDPDPADEPTSIVRQDDPVDDAAWFAGLREMARQDDEADAFGTSDQDDDTDGSPVEPWDHAAGPDDDVWARALLADPEPEPLVAPVDQTPAVASAPVVETLTTSEADAAPDAGEASIAHDIDEAPVADVPRRSMPPRPRADVQQIVPASVPRPRHAAMRWIAVGAAVLVVLGAGVTVALNRGGGQVAADAGTSVTTQHAVVVAFSLSPDAAKAAQVPVAKPKKGSKAPAATVVQPQPGDVTGLSLLAAGGGSAQQVLVPSRLLLDVPGAGRVPMSRSLAGSPDAPGEAITDALEVAVDATWTLDSTALATLVDRVGGVVVDVDADVTKGTQVGAAVLLGAGPQQKLAGQQAALFAQFLGPDEPEAARLARQEQVLRAVLTALPDDPATIRTIIGDLPGAPQGAALDAVARVVSASRLAATSHELASTVLPVKEIDAGGTVVSYGLDDKAATELVTGRLAGARLPVAGVGHVRVLVQNGVGAPGLGNAARSKLLAAGLRYVAGGNLPGFGQKQTVVLLRDASSDNRTRGMAVARALGLGESSLRISETAPTIADIVVILGEDFGAR